MEASAVSGSGPEDVPCDVCIGKTLNALQDAVSYCERHLPPNNALPGPSQTDEPTTREDFLKYSTQITLDPNTAHARLCLTEGNRRVTVMEEDQSRPDHMDRFISYGQVLSTESLMGRCYWELDWDGHWVYIAVSYRDIDRNGLESGFGFNDKSWALDCGQNVYAFWAHREETEIPGPVGSRIGVFLDHSAGVLSFYSVSETMRLIRRVQTTFTQSLAVGVCLNWYKVGDTVAFPVLTEDSVQDVIT